MLEDTLRFFNTLMPNTKLLYCPELGVKLRTSGINNYVTKLYDLGPAMLDGAQTTALNQPFLSGNIAPNEKYAIKNPNGGSAYITHTPISFSATDEWSASTIVNSYGSPATQYPYYAGHPVYGLGLQNGSSFEIRFVNNVSSASASTKKYIGKNSVITWVSIGNGSLHAYINGELLQTFSGINTEYIESEIGRGRGGSLSYQNSGTIQYHCIRDIALSPTQVQDEYNYLRTLFPEIESAQIGTQTWATSNCEMTCTPQGNIIQEIQAATNVDIVTNGGFDMDTEWIKIAGVTINGGALNINSSSISSKAYQVKTISPNSYYKVTYTVLNYVSGASAISVGGIGSTGIKSGNGTYSQYFKTGASPSNVIQIWGFGSDANEFSIDNVYVQEVGWADSTNLYNEVYAQTTGTAEQKEYAAVKAAAMWCHYNNDPTIGAVYGKLYNWYAVRLLQMDIDYYNAANPTAPWGWRVPSSTDYITLSSTLGNTDISGAFLKKEGTSYWNLPNTNANNQSRFTAIGIGRRAINGTFEELNNIFNTHNLDKSKTVLSNASESVSFQGGTNPVWGMGLRLIKDEPVANSTLHGFEYTPGQNDDIVTLIGNSEYNTSKPIQSAMRPFEELITTKERYYLQDNVALRIDGTASHLTDPNYLQKVSIPEFWYGARFDSVRNKVQVWFSLVPVPGFMHIAPQAICRYPGYIDGTGKARSHSGFKYPNNKNLIEFTTACQLTSTDLFVLPYYTYNALSLLLLHDIGRRNAQAVWAGLQTGFTYSNITSGKTDVLTTPSGEVPADAETASNKPFRWRFIENLYGDCWKILSGVYLNQVGAERRVMVCPDPYKANTSSVISADYIQTCIIAAGEGWLKDINAPWINAKAYGASSTTGYCDYTYNNTTDKNILFAGGYSNFGAADGPFSLDSYHSASSSYIHIGALFASIDRLPAATQVVVPAIIY